MRGGSAARALACGVLCATGVGAQAAPPSPAGLTLEDVLQTTLASSPTIQTGQWTVRSSEGNLIAAQAPFDPQAQSSISNLHNNTLNSLTGTGTSYYLAKQMGSTVTLTKLFPWGLSVSPSVNVTNTQISLVPGASNSSAVGLVLGMQLLRDRFGAVTASTARAAERDYQGAQLDFRTTAASTVLGVAEAYWSYVAAVREADAYAQAESREAQNVDETRRLVAAEERTPADLVQVMGQLATERASRLSADQAVVAAREQLGLAMGVPASAVLSLAAPATDFPPVGAPGDSSAQAAVIAAAPARRPDVAALEKHLESSRIQVAAAVNSALPSVDLQLSVGYTGGGSGWGVSNYVDALGRNVPGGNVSIQLSTALPIGNSAAHGETEQLSAAAHQQQVAEDALRRQVTADVQVALTALRANADALKAATDAVQYADETVSAQRQRFKAGLATVFDVLLSESSLTSAQLNAIASREAYADAIAQLRYASGTLLTTDQGPLVSAAALLSPP